MILYKLPAPSVLSGDPCLNARGFVYRIVRHMSLVVINDDQPINFETTLPGESS
jgi:hypothetical protein